MAENLDTAAELFGGTWEQFSGSTALQLAGEALVMRVGDLAKRLSSLEPVLRNRAAWQSAARARDLVAHHYHRLDTDQLWFTVTESFATLKAELDEITDRKGTIPTRSVDAD